MKIIPSTFSPPQKPLFVAFEGINGCGKSTLHRAVSEQLRARGVELVDTREPGGTALGTEIRKLLLEWSGAKKSDLSELLLFAADRAEHVETVIKPALIQGRWVLCDRYIYSTITFQGHGRGISRDIIDHANALATQGLTPDLVVLLDVDPQVALTRISKRVDNGKDNFEDEQIDFHTRIRNGFLECAEKLPVPFLVLDATKSPQELVTETLAVVGV